MGPYAAFTGLIVHMYNASCSTFALISETYGFHGVPRSPDGGGFTLLEGNPNGNGVPSSVLQFQNREQHTNQEHERNHEWMYWFSCISLVLGSSSSEAVSGVPFFSCNMIPDIKYKTEDATRSLCLGPRDKGPSWAVRSLYHCHYH